MAKKIFIGADSLKEKKQKSSELDSGQRNRGPIEEINRWLASQGSLKLKDKVTFYRLFATMINSGISVIKSLSILKDQIESPKLQIIIENLVDRIEKGDTLSRALSLYPKEFLDAEVGMIHAGEESGKLNTALVNLADQTEKSSSLTKKLKGAMIYPAVVFLMLIGALFAVMTFVIPQIKDMFESFGAELPLPTQMLITMSDFMTAHGGPLGLLNALNVIILIVAFIVGVMYFKTTPMGRPLWDGFLLRIPIFGILNQKVALAKMCRGIATLTSSGIPIIKALSICADMIGNELYKKRVLRVSEDVKIGISIADNMRGDSRFFPNMLVSMIGVGEQTAQLDKITMKIAEFYEEEVADMVKNITALLEPIIIVAVGLSVGGLVVAIMLPILSLSDLAGGG
jgi:type IV pilus assembly protein PilC